ncbi:MAG: transglycosylase domain-containing protein [Phascolarctobacterium sp.]
MPKALIAIEDHDFYNHGAIAIDGILRATLVNLSAGEVVQGGSTLTQQFVKNVFLSHEQSMERKIEEAILSLMLEDNYSKDEILELYLNTTYLGAGTGIKQASQTYFGKAPSALTLAEATVIASLPYAPTALNPLENPQVQKTSTPSFKCHA